MKSPFKLRNNYGWTELSPDQLSIRIKESAKQIVELKEKLKFDAVAFSGSSGAAIAFYLTIEHNIPIIYARKDNEKSHGTIIEGNKHTKGIKKYLIVDDFVCSGDTIRHIHKQISTFCSANDMTCPKLAGVYCYMSSIRDDTIVNGKPVKIYPHTS